MSLVKEFGFKKKSITDLQLFIDLSPVVNFIPILQAAFCANIIAPNICKAKL
jgi:hypothetical protein